MTALPLPQGLIAVAGVAVAGIAVTGVRSPASRPPASRPPAPWAKNLHKWPQWTLGEDFGTKYIVGMLLWPTRWGEAGFGTFCSMVRRLVDAGGPSRLVSPGATWQQR